MKKWTNEEVEILKEMNNNHYTLKDISLKLNKSKDTIRAKIKYMGLDYNYKKEKGNYNDVIGKKCGHLTITKFIKRENKTNYYLCVCDCGNEKITSSRDLLYNKSPNISCGCRRWDNTNKKNIAGQKFNRLTAIKDSGQRVHGEVMWECLCDCGNTCYVAGYNLRNGHTNSCGCYMVDRIIEACKKETEFDLENYPWGVGWTSNTNEIFIFDKEDFDKIKNYCWYKDAYGYISTTVEGKTTKLHRIIMNVIDRKIQVDHIQHIKMDNRKSKLRLVTNMQNAANRKPQNKNKTKGVTFDEKRNKWISQITHNYKHYNLGIYDTKKEAIKARKKAEERYQKEFSYDNSMNNKDVKKHD